MTKTTEVVVPTVVLAEVAPQFLYGADLESWARVARVTIREDYLGRPAVTLADAYRLREQNKRAEAEARKGMELRGAVATADQRRLEIYSTAFGDAMQRTTYRTPSGYDASSTPVADPADPFKARAEALAAVAEFDETLPRDVRERLNGLPLWPARQM